MYCVLVLLEGQRYELRGKQVKGLRGPATVIEEFRVIAYAAHWDKILGRETRDSDS